MSDVTRLLDAAAAGDRRAAADLLPEAGNIVMLAAKLFARGAALELLGFKPADALHVAARKQPRRMSC